VRPTSEDFWFRVPENDNSVKELALFDECKKFLRVTDDLVGQARKLFASIHQGHAFTLPR